MSNKLAHTSPRKWPPSPKTAKMPLPKENAANAAPSVQTFRRVWSRTGSPAYAMAKYCVRRSPCARRSRRSASRSRTVLNTFYFQYGPPSIDDWPRAFALRSFLWLVHPVVDEQTAGGRPGRSTRYQTFKKSVANTPISPLNHGRRSSFTRHRQIPLREYELFGSHVLSPRQPHPKPTEWIKGAWNAP